MIGYELQKLPVSEVQQALFVLDGLSHMSDIEPLVETIKSKYVHIIVISRSCESFDKMIKDIDQELIRGCRILNIQPLSIIHSTQRIVYSLMRDRHFTPSNHDQQAIEKLAEYTTGSPVIIDITMQVVPASFQNKPAPIQSTVELLSLNTVTRTSKGNQTRFVERDSTMMVRSVSDNVRKLIGDVIEVPGPEQDVWATDTQCDSWDSVMCLVDNCDLNSEEKLLLNCLSIFSGNPIPFCVVTELALLISKSAQKSHLAGTLHSKLMRFHLVRTYPYPIVFHSSVNRQLSHCNPEFIHVPQYLSQCIWKYLTDLDHIAALTTMYNVMLNLQQSSSGCEYLYCATLCSLLLEAFELNFTLVGRDSYKSVYSLVLAYQ